MSTFGTKRAVRRGRRLDLRCDLVAMLAMLAVSAPLQAAVPITGAAEVAVSGYYACVRTTGGAVSCWGDNAIGRLGDGTLSSRITAVQVAGLGSGVRMLSSSALQSCVVTTEGAAKCWGSNSFGGVGDGSRTTRTTPVDVSGLGSGVAAIATGWYHTCALTTGGGVKCWGRNNSGQIGDGTTTDRLTPIDVPGLGSGVLAIGAGAYHTCAATSVGVKCWGRNTTGQLGDGTTTQRTTPTDIAGMPGGVKQIGAGRGHTCALTAAGGVRCWGANDYRQLGDGTSAQRPTPADVTGLGGGVTALAVGSEHNCALTPAGGLKCWGQNSYGQLGDGTTSGFNKNLIEPQGMAGGVVGVAAGDYRSCAVITGGGVKCWGGLISVPAGDGGDPFRPLSGDVTGLGNGVAVLGAGAQHDCVLVGSGVKCWGNNSLGQLGDNFATPYSATPLAVTGLGSGVRALYTGSAAHHNCVTMADGKLRCWGYGYSGQLGNGDTRNSGVPVDVALPPNAATHVGPGSSHTCAAMASGGVQCWGANGIGQLGDGTTTDRPLPGPVTGLTGGFTAVVGGFEHSCALSNAGGVKCWGGNAVGQLGDGNVSQRSLVPVDVRGLESGVIAITSGLYHNCALTSGGGVKCWGYNPEGRLGNGAMGGSKLTPVDVVGLASGATAISAGSMHTCALGAGGAPLCWGSNAAGQFGDGRYYARSHPGAAGGMSAGIAQVAASMNHTCVLTTGGGVKCWGTKVDGALGNGTLPPAVPLTPAGMARTVPDQLAVVQLNGGNPVYAGESFTATVEAGAAAVAGGVQSATPVTLALGGGTGPLNGSASCTIPAGGHLCTVEGLTLATAQTGVVLVAHRTGGDALADGTSAAFAVYPNTVPNYQGLWWNPNESGWGINFAHQGDIVFATWFTYDKDGKPWWLIAQLEKKGSGVYSGPVSTVVGPPWNSVPFDSSKIAETIVGEATVTFASESSGSFAYTVNGKAQTKAIVPQEFPKRPTCSWGTQPDLALATNYTDLWWNSSESGWGINLSHQGDVIFATWFTYDKDGKPWWLIAQLEKKGSGVYAGPVSTVVGSPWDSVPFDSGKVVETVVGTATLTFANGNSASFDYTVNDTKQTKGIVRQVFVAPGTTCS